MRRTFLAMSFVTALKLFEVSAMISQDLPVIIEDRGELIFLFQLPDEDYKLLADIDSINRNNLTRCSDLDSAAMQHAFYLARLIVEEQALSHQERNDYKNFTEKLNVRDRISGTARCAEIIAHSTAQFKLLKYDPDEMNEEISTMRKSVNDEWIRNNIQKLTQNDDAEMSRFTKIYQDSPKHNAIINNESFHEFGIYTFLLFAYTKKTLEQQRINFLYQIEKWRKLNYSKQAIDRSLVMASEYNIVRVMTIINVTVFRGKLHSK